MIDSHPVPVCKLVRAGPDTRLDGLARTGYCASMKTYFHGVREHLIYTPQGRIAFVQQIPGNRHDVKGLYALLQTSFKGALLADAGYLPKKKKRARTHGFLKRSRTQGGRRVLRKRRAKGRKVLSR